MVNGIVVTGMMVNGNVEDGFAAKLKQ